MSRMRTGSFNVFSLLGIFLSVFFFRILLLSFSLYIQFNITFLERNFLNHDNANENISWKFAYNMHR